MRAKALSNMKKFDDGSCRKLEPAIKNNVLTAISQKSMAGKPLTEREMVQAAGLSTRNISRLHKSGLPSDHRRYLSYVAKGRGGKRSESTTNSTTNSTRIAKKAVSGAAKQPPVQPSTKELPKEVVEELTGVAVSLGDRFGATASKLTYPPDQIEFMRGIAAKEARRRDYHLKYKDLLPDALESLLGKCTDTVEKDVISQLLKESPLPPVDEKKAKAVVDRIVAGSRMTRATSKTMADIGIVVQVDGEGASVQAQPKKAKKGLQR